MSSKAASSALALLVFCAGCLEYRTDDKPFLCEGAQCTVVSDGGSADAGVDAGLDAGVDAGLDAGVDAGLDAGMDAGLDAGMDAGLDAGVDAGLDAGVDAGLDAGVDAGPDAGMDAGLDAGVDAGIDAGVDAGLDAGVDAGLDAGGDAGLFVTSLGRWRRVHLAGDEVDFGASVDLSDDARTLVVGAPSTPNDGGDRSGRVFLFQLTGTNVVLQHVLEAPAPARRFGAAVSISADGRRLVVGAPGDLDGGAQGGTAWVFVWNAADGGFTPVAVPGSARVSSGSFGHSVSWAPRADVFAVGAPGQGLTDAGPRTGTVDVFRFDGGQVSLHAAVTDSRLDALDQFGWSVALNDDGTTLVVGAPEDDSDSTANNTALPGSGAAYAFIRTGSSWSRQWVFKAAAPVVAGGTGSCVSLDAPGTSMVVGGARPAASQVDFEPWGRSFGTWSLQSGASMLQSGATRPACFLTSGGSWLVGSQGGQATLAPTSQPGAATTVTPPLPGTAFGAALGGSPDGSVLVFSDVLAADGGVVWLLWR